MARKAAHDQKSTPSNWVCDACRNGICSGCIDIMRIVVLGKNPMCYCKRRNHSGEPNQNQVRDPETNIVWAPGLRVTPDGEVIRMTENEDGSVTEKVITDSVPTYRYRDANLDIIWTTSVPKDDEAAFAYFHAVMRFGDKFRPVYVEKNTAGPEREKYEMLPVMFDCDDFRVIKR